MNIAKKGIAALAAAAVLSLAPAAAYADNGPTTVSPAPNSSTAEHDGHAPHPHQGKGFRAGGYFILNETSRLLEMDRAELVNSLRGGKTLYALAKEKKGWSEEKYLQKLGDAAGLRVDESVKEGKLTKAEAAKLKAGLPALMKLTINNAASFQNAKPAPGPRSKSN